MNEPEQVAILNTKVIVNGNIFDHSYHWTWSQIFMCQ